MGHDVTILDNITTGQLSNTPIKAKLINIDLADKESLIMIPVEDYKAILHLAAQTSGEISNEKTISRCEGPDHELKQGSK